ncbi:hypothetical protein [Pimelobacter sp. 30-1]|uniref:hypothetical protein n=1 Tax=Pimelobacter sp. 30-1 TaxID=2004991 RepID=UPI001C04D5AC|nr:hypothetical protein [Pimelobacter sp. 30-1]MBU2693858.1 hypothetical protein [Pimelobacter sp. 30-1]
MPSKTVLIYADGDFERLAEARQNVGVAERQALAAQAAPGRLGDDVDADAEVAAAQARYDEIVDEATARAEEWVIGSIGHEEWRSILAEHPPRKVPGEGENPAETDHPDDADWGVNIETFGKALLMYADPEDDVHRTVVKAGDVALDTIGGLGRRIKRLSIGQLETLWVTAYVLNTGGISDPKAARYSPGVPKSDAT